MLVGIDELKLYFRKDYAINNNIVMKQPTVGQIVDFGEREYFSIAQTLTAIPSDMKSTLWDAGIDYEEISDFDLFILLTRGLKREQTKLLLGDLDLSEFERCIHPDNGQVILYNFDTHVIIDELSYILMSNYICKLHGFKKKIEKSGNKFTKKIMIDDDRNRIEMAKGKEYKSQLLPLISSMVNSPGFKYSSQQLLNIGIYEFMDSVSRIATIKHADSLTMGIYSGKVDASKISKSELNWMKDLKS